VDDLPAQPRLEDRLGHHLEVVAEPLRPDLGRSPSRHRDRSFSRYARPVEAHNEVVQREFAAQAASFGDPRYVFADTEILDWILEHIPHEPHFTALDVAAGAGHLARAVAARVRQVVALDLTPEMLVA